MKTLIPASLGVLVLAAVVAEVAMQPSPADRAKLYGVFVGMAVVTLLAAVLALSATRRLRSIVTGVRLVALTAVVTAGGAVAVSAASMFLSNHDLVLVMVALLLGVGLGGVLAVGVARPLIADLEKVSEAAGRVASGDLSMRTGINRRDELGSTAAAVDEMIKRLAKAERERAADAEERRRLFEAVGHDLRTPLASLQAAVEALQDGVATDQDRYLRAMARDVGHLRQLIDDLSYLARIESGRFEFHSEVVDLAELADEALEALAPVAAARSVHLRVNGPGALPIESDANALGRVFRNLLDNAIRHTPPGSAVSVALAKTDGKVSVQVIDEGPGFPAELRSTAFDRFVTGDGSRNRELGGAGLGLAIARGIVEGHGGSISIEEGPGGRVTFELPAVPDPS